VLSVAYVQHRASIEGTGERFVRKHLCAYSDSYTLEELQTMATQYDLVIVHNDSVAVTLKTRKPAIIVLLYADVMAMHEHYEGWKEVSSRDDWFVHDYEGSKLLHKDFNWYLMDVGNQGWVNYYIGRVKVKLESFGYDGVFADDVWSSLDVEFRRELDHRPAPPAANKIATWHADMLEMLKAVKKSIGNKLLVYNGVDWKDLDLDYLEVADGVMLEGFARPRLSEVEWKHQLSRLIDAGKRGKIFLAQSLITPTATKQEGLAQMFCLASYLLGADKTSFFNVAENYTSLDYLPECNLEIGHPIGSYYESQGIYQRRFACGTALVNPSEASRKVRLDGAYGTAYIESGRPTVLTRELLRELTLQPRSGAILAKHHFDK